MLQNYYRLKRTIKRNRTTSHPLSLYGELLFQPTPISLYIDADACLVKQEVYRVAERHAGKGTALKVFVVSNAPIAVPRHGRIEGGERLRKHQFDTRTGT